MTPFDPWALLAILEAFYPEPTAASLRRARSERPEYFAGGTLIGRSGDKLQLPDGRIWDLIFGVDGPRPPRRWIAIDVTDPDPNAVPGFELEPGPLEPLDEEMLLFPPHADIFTPLVAGHLEGLEGSDGVLATAATAVLAHDGAGRLERDWARVMEPAIAQHATIRVALDGDDPIAVLAAATGHDGEIEGGRRDYDEPPPPDIAEPSVGEPPGKGEPGGPEPPAL